MNLFWFNYLLQILMIFGFDNKSNSSERVNKEESAKDIMPYPFGMGIGVLVAVLIIGVTFRLLHFIASNL